MLGNLKTHAAAAQSRFPRQHGPEIRPTGIKNTLCHAGLSEFRGAHVANGNEPVLLHKLRRFLMQKILPSISDFGVNGLHAVALTGSLRGRKLLLAGAIECRHGYRAAAGHRRQRLGAEVYAELVVDCLCRFRHLERNVDGPAATPILRERPTTDLGGVRQWSVQKYTVDFAAKYKTAVAKLYRLLIERHPAERTTRALSFAPAQPRLYVAADAKCRTVDKFAARSANAGRVLFLCCQRSIGASHSK